MADDFPSKHYLRTQKLACLYKMNLLVVKMRLNHYVQNRFLSLPVIELPLNLVHVIYSFSPDKMRSPIKIEKKPSTRQGCLIDYRICAKLNLSFKLFQSADEL